MMTMMVMRSLLILLVFVFVVLVLVDGTHSFPARKLQGLNATSTNPPSADDLNRGVLIAIVTVPVICGIIMLASFILWAFRHDRFHNTTDQPPSLRHSKRSDTLSDGILSLGPWLTRWNSFRVAIKRKGADAYSFEYAFLQAATNNFSSDNMLGTGGSACVFKARLGDDEFAAVKKLNVDNTTDQSFKMELDLMSRIRHDNLVSLLGYCIHGNLRFLVYELMQNGSLEYQLHGPPKGSALTWHFRLKIALDAARGLAHLHEGCDAPIIHRDFKSSNILLDTSFNAKLADFGLALSNDAMALKGKCIELQGTLGYVAPEYMLHGTVSEKSDVYAFGVVLLELITGKMPIDKSLPVGCQSLVTWSVPKLTDRAKLVEIVDPSIKHSLNLKHLHQVAAVAALCLQEEASYRPLIADVAHTLVPLVPVELGGALKVPPPTKSPPPPPHPPLHLPPQHLDKQEQLHEKCMSNISHTSWNSKSDQLSDSIGHIEESGEMRSS